MFTELLHNFAKIFESLILCLTVKIAVVNLLQNNGIAKMPINQIKSEVRRIDTGYTIGTLSVADIAQPTAAGEQRAPI